MKKFFKVIGIGTAICTAVGVAVVVTKKIIDKVKNNDDVVEDEDPEFVDEETAEKSEKSDTTKTE